MAAVGSEPPIEVMAASEGLSRQQRRAAALAVRRGTAVEDPAAARLAVALARNELSQKNTLADTTVLALVIAVAFGFALWRLTVRDTIGAAVVGSFALLGAFSLVRSIRPARTRAAREAERLNRGLLERRGSHTRISERPGRSSRPSTSWCSALLCNGWCTRPSSGP